MSIEATVVVGRHTLAGVITNMNLGGFFITLGKPVPVGELVRLTLKVPDQHPAPMECLGCVRTCDLAGEGGAGIQFFAMPKDVSARWVAYYQRCIRPSQSLQISAAR